MDIDQYSETEVRELERKFDPDDTVAEVLIELANNMPRRVSGNRNVCPPEAEQLGISAEPTYL